MHHLVTTDCTCCEPTVRMFKNKGTCYCSMTYCNLLSSSKGILITLNSWRTAPLNVHSLEATFHFSLLVPAAHFSILTRVSFLFVCSALWCVPCYYHRQVLESWQALKRPWRHKGSGIRSSGTQHLTYWSDIYISKEADEMNRGTFTISDGPSCSTTSILTPSLPLSVSLSAFLSH